MAKLKMLWIERDKRNKIEDIGIGRQDEERMQLYTEWLQDRSQYGSGKRRRSKRRRRRRNKSRRKIL